jgi:hypothetical protein
MSAGQIHDLGYKRYAGPRQAVSMRWRVVMRQQLASAWKTFFRYKAWLSTGVIITCVAGGLMYIATLLPDMHALTNMLTGSNGKEIALADVPLPFAIGWYCRAAFLASLTVGVGVIANDVRSGAFTFYFARSLRPADYVLGKVTGMWLVMASFTLTGPLLLALMRLTLSSSVDDLIHLLPIVPKALFIGSLSALTFAAVPLAFSALIAHRGYALAAWAAYYVIAGSIAMGIGLTSAPSVAAFDLLTAIQTIAFWLFDVRPVGSFTPVPIGAAFISLAIQISVAILIAYVSVARARDSGVGGAT